MTQTYSIQGRRAGLFSTFARTAFLAVAAIGGIFILVFSFAFALLKRKWAGLAPPRRPSLKPQTSKALL